MLLAPVSLFRRPAGGPVSIFRINIPPTLLLGVKVSSTIESHSAVQCSAEQRCEGLASTYQTNAGAEVDWWRRRWTWASAQTASTRTCPVSFCRPPHLFCKDNT